MAAPLEVEIELDTLAVRLGVMDARLRNMAEELAAIRADVAAMLPIVVVLGSRVAGIKEGGWVILS